MSPPKRGGFSPVVKMTRRSQKLWDDLVENAPRRIRRVRVLVSLHIAEFLRLRLVAEAPRLKMSDDDEGFDYASRIKVVMIDGLPSGKVGVGLTVPVHVNREWRDRAIRLKFSTRDLKTMVLRAEFGFDPDTYPAWRPALESLKGERRAIAEMVVEYVAKGRNRFLNPGSIDTIQAASISPEADISRRLKVSFSE